MKKISALVAVVGLIVGMFASQLSAQVVVGGGGNGGVTPQKTTIVVPDISYLTNHAELVGQVLKHVNGVRVQYTASAATRDGSLDTFMIYTNSVKTLEGIAALVTNNWWTMSVVDTNASISIQVLLYDTADQNTALGYTPNVSSQVLFEGYNGGVPIRNQYGQWALPEWAETVSLRISGSIFVAMTNVVSAHIVTKDMNGNTVGFDLPVTYLQGFSFQPDYAGSAIVVLGSYTFSTNGWVSYNEHAYDLGNNAVEVPITPIMVRAILQDSDDFRTSVDQTNLVYTVYSYNGYGKVPLLTPTFNKAMNVMLSVSDQLGNSATSFVIEDQATNVRTTINVPTGMTAVSAMIPKGIYHIIPLGLNLKSPYYYGYGYGEKG